MDFLEYLFLIVLAHQFFTLFTYLNLLIEDGKWKCRHPVAFRRVMFGFCYLFFIGEFFYQCTIGLIDHLREKRLCRMLVEYDDKTKDLAKENQKLKSELDDHRAYVQHLADDKLVPRWELFDNFVRVRHILDEPEASSISELITFSPPDRFPGDFLM